MRLFRPLELLRPKDGVVYPFWRYHLLSLGFGLLLMGFGGFSSMVVRGFWDLDGGVFSRSGGGVL